MKIRTGLVAGTVLTLGLLTACGGDGDPQDTDATGGAKPKASPSATKGTGPAYEGDELPGLSAEPAWSLKAPGLKGCADDPAKAAATEVVNFDAQTCVLGDAVVLTEDLSEHAEGEATDSRFRARLYDPATGEVRRTVDVTVPAEWQGDRDLSLDQFMQVSEWKDGSPALLVVSGDVVEGDGLKKASITTTYTMYAPSGKELGSSTLSGEDGSRLTVEAGHLLTKEEYKKDTYTPIGGGTPVEVRDRGLEQAPLGAGFGYRVVSTWSVIDGSGSRLSVSDRLTGKELWNLRDVDRPAALADVEDLGDLEARLLPLTDDKGILAWEQPGDDADDEILTVVDLGTGRLIAEGPEQDLDELSRGWGSTVLSPDGGTVVTQFGGGAVAWNTETGAELWRQEADEHTITPLGLTAGGVLYASVDTMGITALELKTKKVLASDLVEYQGVPLTGNVEPLQFTTDGYAVLAAADLFVFAPEEKQ
ncbi:MULTISPECIES: PQQ-binding-like beta-propeller repeat protein [Streptomyces]|uniref:PQQ-binding-like beta-propeller repeat protein n=1 Tax=Streptomyces caniscabiei TaxID=2746961 RepID=A0ABU4MIY9_9ACTN|nr:MULTISPECIES: PQQ-binding-like beta-propeller repeat protein [Streptomyces]MDX2941194.1 PQQ-binding-like beta-propeller repeat protein [Streptomyces caniscabiei]MDX2953507.1 PQQ-binding-like beta-propeller repeat protein [Streptomyces caniscabiei]MDX2987156.1 PQQ-binding-like beta-propeller repeat protein [Streptomyces caniscabiei]MDX3009790.1 PQQ-binding-like beta-propeller repeat protein [Streptomyces caniscabiei]MDX3037434.1 PQQ-binding-like beta-propeller repeat protein [Streptomyces ca